MFIPLIVAILLGLIAPTSNNANCANGTVYVSNSEPGEGDPGDPGDGDPEDGDPDGGDTGEDGPGGDNGHIPPPKP